MPFPILRIYQKLKISHDPKNSSPILGLIYHAVANAHHGQSAYQI